MKDLQLMYFQAELCSKIGKPTGLFFVRMYCTDFPGAISDTYSQLGYCGFGVGSLDTYGFNCMCKASCQAVS